MSNKEVIDMLEEFIITGKVRSPQYGLCKAVYDCQENKGLGSAYINSFKHLVDIFKTWEYFSGDKTFPIKSPWYGFSSPSEYYGKGMYRGRQLKLRKHLAQHIINCLKESK